MKFKLNSKCIFFWNSSCFLRRCFVSRGCSRQTHTTDRRVLSPSFTPFLGNDHPCTSFLHNYLSYHYPSYISHYRLSPFQEMTALAPCTICNRLQHCQFSCSPFFPVCPSLFTVCLHNSLPNHYLYKLSTIAHHNPFYRK